MPGSSHSIYLLYSLNVSFRTFNSTIIRRIGLFQGKHFSCECIRCKDPTEMSSYASAVLCSCGGIVIAEDPLDLTREAVWKCQECGLTIPALQVKGCLHIFLFNFNILFKKFQIASQEKDVVLDLNSIQRDDIRGLEDFLSRNKKILHQNHSAMMEVDNFSSD